MKVELKTVSKDEKEILRNLLEKYDYEFSQWTNRDVNNLGLYGYDYLDYYWTEDNRHAFFIMADGKLAGFIMVNGYPETGEPTDYCLSEFFVMYKYRRMGIGSIAALKAFDLFHGKWQLKRHPHNFPSVHFWNKLILEYTQGKYRLVESHPSAEYEDGTAGDVFFFEN